jgi:Flp pilus assembly pilin Flp
VLTSRWHLAALAVKSAPGLPQPASKSVDSPRNRWPDSCTDAVGGDAEGHRPYPFRPSLMEEIMSEMKRILKETRGSYFVEYMIICGVVALLAITAFTTFGKDVQDKIKEEGGKVTGIQN